MDRSDPTRRFSSRVNQYARHRPGYPDRLVDFLRETCALAPHHVVADVGCGTGLLADLFLRNGNRVYGIEPNPEMRAEAERVLGHDARFRSVDARGEGTTLPEASVDFVTVGRTFHWLDPEPALAEFARILRPDGWAVIVWLNKTSASAFLAEYQTLRMTYTLDRAETLHRRRRLQRLLIDRAFRCQVFEDRRTVTLESLEGQTLSYSDALPPDHPRFVPMRDALRRLFDKYQQDGQVALEYALTIYYTQRP